MPNHSLDEGTSFNHVPLEIGAISYITSKEDKELLDAVYGTEFVV